MAENETELGSESDHEAATERSPSDSLIGGSFGALLSTVPRQISALVGIPLILLFVAAAIIWQDHLQSSKNILPWIVVFILVGVAIVLLLFTFKRAWNLSLQSGVAKKLSSPTTVKVLASEVAQAVRTTPRWENAGLLVGARLGRHSITCGALKVVGAPSALLPPNSNLYPIGQPITQQIRSEAAFEDRLNLLASLIGRVANEAWLREPELVIEGIGIGTPGFVNVRDKSIDHGIDGVPPNTHLGSEIASRLSRDASLVALMKWQGEHQIYDICHIDNDIRCATRLILSRHQNDVDRDSDDYEWKNVCTLHLGSGVGCGLILDNGLFYGSRFFSGEIGHTEIPTKWLENTEAHRVFGSVDECATCMNSGLHFESVVNYGGLLKIAEVQNCEMYQELARYLETRLPDATEITRRAWPALVGSGGLQPQIEREIAQFVSDPRWQGFLTQTLESYVESVSTGIASVVNLLSIRRVCLLGSLYDQLRDYGHFDRMLESSLRTRLGRRAPALDHDDVSIAMWQGAALIARDWKFGQR